MQRCVWSCGVGLEYVDLGAVALVLPGRRREVSVAVVVGVSVGVGVLHRHLRHTWCMGSAVHLVGGVHGVGVRCVAVLHRHQVDARDAAAGHLGQDTHTQRTQSQQCTQGLRDGGRAWVWVCGFGFLRARARVTGLGQGTLERSSLNLRPPPCTRSRRTYLWSRHAVAPVPHMMVHRLSSAPREGARCGSAPCAALRRAIVLHHVEPRVAAHRERLARRVDGRRHDVVRRVHHPACATRGAWHQQCT